MWLYWQQGVRIRHAALLLAPGVSAKQYEAEALRYHANLVYFPMIALEPHVMASPK